MDLMNVKNESDLFAEPGVDIDIVLDWAQPIFDMIVKMKTI